jgi:hypothetical protein
MRREILRTIVLGVFSLVVALTIVPGAMWEAHAQDAKTPYPNMVPLEQYLTERNTEIALARSAAPKSISRDAEVMVLGRHGYEIAAQGKNGFVRMAERSWNRRPRFLESQAAGSDLLQSARRAILSSTHDQENRVGAGRTIQSADVRGPQTAFDKKELPALETGAMCYMTSKQGYLSDRDGASAADVFSRKQTLQLAVRICRAPRLLKLTSPRID